MTHTLPTLPYAADALEPHIDALTMQLHHGKHHAGYVDNLNKALAAYPQLQNTTAAWLLQNLDELPSAIRKVVRQNAGGHMNHSQFWRAMTPNGGGVPGDGLAEAITRDFGGIDSFKTAFEAAGMAVFGSGWVWLVREQRDGGMLKIITTKGHDNPITQGHFPLLVNDVWEHAYYLKHHNRRADYLREWWVIVNWAEAARRYERSDGAAVRDWEDEGGQVLAAKA